MDVAGAWRFLEQSDLVASAEEVQAALRRVASDVEARLAGAYPLVLAVMGGAVVFAGQLLPLLRFPLDFDYIHVSRYGAGTRGAAVDWRVTPTESVRGRAVLVVDDILDRGHTLAALGQELAQIGVAAQLTAVLVVKRVAASEPRPRVHFAGVEVDDVYVFGCGMDYRGHWRGLRALYALEAPHARDPGAAGRAP